MSSTLASQAAAIVANLRANGFEDDGGMRQALCLAEEAGEFVGAFRRWKGMARRSGTEEEVRAELADVAITAYVAAEEIGFDLDAAIAAKLDIVFSRGWRERTQCGGAVHGLSLSAPERCAYEDGHEGECEA